MRTVLLTGLLSAATFASSQAISAGEPKYDEWVSAFRRADINDSGGLSKIELDKTPNSQFRSIRKHFQKIDANQDGQVSMKEFSDFEKKRREAWESSFNKADLNNSGGLSRVELEKTPAGQFPLMKRQFDVMDTNRDGHLTIAERDNFNAAKKSPTDWQPGFKKADLNDSGGLSKAELAKTPSGQFEDLKKNFSVADSNRDGQVTVAEYEAFLDDDDEQDESGLASYLQKLFK